MPQLRGGAVSAQEQPPVRDDAAAHARSGEQPDHVLRALSRPQPLLAHHADVAWRSADAIGTGPDIQPWQRHRDQCGRT